MLQNTSKNQAWLCFSACSLAVRIAHCKTRLEIDLPLILIDVGQ